MPLVVAQGVIDAAELMIVGEAPITGAELVACEVGSQTRSFAFEVDSQRRIDESVVRWGEPAPVARRVAVVLADGSRLLSDRAWSPAGLVRIGDGSVRLRRGRGWVEAPREAVRWVVLDAEAAGLSLDRLDGAPVDGEDTALLTGGDRVAGTVESLSNDTLTIRVADQPIETPLESVAAVRLSGAALDTEAACLVGWDDGSLLRAERFTLSGGAAAAVVAGVEAAVEASSVVFVQPLGGPVRYLSDIEPVDYRHTPYLDLVWPYGRDAGLRGGPLAGGGRRAAKGLAIHSAARLVYRLDGSAERFCAEVAVADRPAGLDAKGSVVFRVYLVKDGRFAPAYESPVVRSGDPARGVDVDLAGAVALALVVDYADGGDAGDHALWLDARFEP